MFVALRLAIAATILLAFEYSGLWFYLISHPFWSLSSTLHGIVAGTIVGVGGLWLARRKKSSFAVLLIVSVLLFVIATAATYWGKNGFAISYAEDAFAGRVWFFGFKAMNLFLFSSLFFAFSLWPAKR